MHILASFVISLALLRSLFAEQFFPEEYVNILGGTDSYYDLSHGNTLPLVARPWGFNTWAPVTDTDPTWRGWWFHPSDRRFFGMRVTHQPSPWIADYGNFIVKATIVKAVGKTDDTDQFSGYSPRDSTFAPYLFSTKLLAWSTEDDDTHLDFSATSHGAIMRYKFPSRAVSDVDKAYVQTRRISIVLNGGIDSSAINAPGSALSVDNTVTITGFTNANSGGLEHASSFKHFFAAAIHGGKEGNQAILKYLNSDATNKLAWVEFDSQDEAYDTLTIRVATSFISIEQAIVNLKSEVGAEKSFESVVAESKGEWNKLLSRLTVADVGTGYSASESKDLLTTFYSALYRASLFPRQLTEETAAGELVHWSPYDNSSSSFPGPLSTDSGFWDAYSTVYPFLSIVNRPVLGTMIQGWLNAYTEGGWLPKWASPGYRGSMVGTMGDVTLADAIVKDVGGFDVDVAYAAIRKDAFQVPPSNKEGVGRTCLEAYLKYGYVPKGASATTGGTCSEVVSRSLNYIQSDYAIARAAEHLGRDEDAKILYARSKGYASMFDSTSLFFRSRDILKQQWVEPFDQFAWGGDYTEAGPWQYKFYVPHDAEGLAKLYAEAGSDMCAQLEKTQTMRSTFHIGSYGSEIHEQTEMTECWGQYEHNNQPVHHMLYMFVGADPEGALGSCAAKGQYYLRRAMKQLYKPGVDMFIGDEDNGQMSAWYLLSSLGLYSLSPSSDEYVLGSPLFGRVEVDLSDAFPGAATGNKLVVEALNNSKENVYVQSVAWNGVALPPGAKGISYTKIMTGGTLTFEMGPIPFAEAKALKA